MDSCFNAAFAVYDEIAADNPNFKKVYEAWKPFRKDIHFWFRVAENSFDSFIYAKSAQGA